MRCAALVLLAAVTLAACGKNQSPPPPTTGVPNAQRESAPKDWAGTAPMAKDPAPEQPAAQRAQAMYGMVCAMCHGAEGKGDGKGKGASKPRNYTDAAWQASVTDDDLKKAILLGGAGIGKDPIMPAQPQLKEQPELLDALVAIIRGFKK